MPIIRNINLFIQKKTTTSRIFWGLMYITFFILTIYNEGTTFFENTHVALQFIIVPFFVIPSVHLLHEATKDSIKTVETVFGEEGVNFGRRFLTIAAFPTFGICLGERFEDDNAALWSCIGVVGSIFSLVICYANPNYYGSSDAVLGICLAVLVSLEEPLHKCIVGVVIIVVELVRRILEGHFISLETLEENS